MKKVGIITWHYYGNFGSVLQAYALQEAIREMGYDVEFVNYRNLKFGKPNPAKTSVKLLLPMGMMLIVVMAIVIVPAMISF